MYEQTQQLIKSYLNEGVFPGVSYAFIRGEEVEERTAGAAQIFPVREKLTAALLFDVASLTKVICTTTVVLQLAEEKIICLDKPLKTYYPVFQDEKVTIRHLLTHTGDINTYIPNRDQLSQKELIEAYSEVHSGEKLGKESNYTDTGTILLGFMLEALLGDQLTDIFTERVLLPLQMTHSCFLPVNPRLTVPTENHPVRGLIRGEVHDPKAKVLAEHSGNAGLFTNLEDLKKFVSMYLNRGTYKGKRILKEETILDLLRDHSFVVNHKRSLGWDLKWRQQVPYLFHTGYTGTFLLMDILKKEAFIFLSNRVHPSDKREEYIEKRDQLLQLYLEEKDS